MQAVRSSAAETRNRPSWEKARLMDPPRVADELTDPLSRASVIKREPWPDHGFDGRDRRDRNREPRGRQ